ncbi:hypothetical protein PAEPH01_1689 [Pancytospora epiphaga]|nr:hypothetical protein PAEPH01_1689 [Pancytospora epiphaga]
MGLFWHMSIYVNILGILKDIGTIEFRVQTIVLKKTLESISYEYWHVTKCLNETEAKPVQRAKEYRHGSLLFNTNRTKSLITFNKFIFTSICNKHTNSLFTNTKPVKNNCFSQKQ